MGTDAAANSAALMALPAAHCQCQLICSSMLLFFHCRTRMGTDAANRSSDQGADSVLWPFTHWDTKLAGSFTRDGEIMDW